MIGVGWTQVSRRPRHIIHGHSLPRASDPKVDTTFGIHPRLPLLTGASDEADPQGHASDPQDRASEDRIHFAEKCSSGDQRRTVDQRAS